MSTILSKILNAKEPSFSQTIHQFEQTSGLQSVDVRLISEMAQTVRKKKSELGLDPNDTTDKELYHGLQNLVRLHDNYLARAIGTHSDDTIDNQLQCILKTLHRLPLNKKCWVIKHSSAKRIVKANPPKKVMKLLGYKSIDSMLKRERISEICAAIRFIETQAWQEKFISNYKKLTPSDFEIRDIEVLLLQKEKWGSSADQYIYAKRHNITHLKELGVVMILPLPLQKLQGFVITVLPIAIHYINEIRSYSAFFKLLQVRHDFGDIIVKAITHDPHSSVFIANQPIHWRSIQRHFGSHRNHKNFDIFDPHVQLDDLLWKTAEEVIYKIEPALKFWEHLDYIGTLHSEYPVPLGLMDNAVSYCNNLEFGHHSVKHFRQSLWNEIYQRYLQTENIEQDVINQLDSQIIATQAQEVK